ncbi:hypothetical protein FOA52_010816 [Chlamydomonas sp. UWO 241]|nr:hypothetical protein FOA52_010816 [Chlamydomonas sp. UWO 241]
MSIPCACPSLWSHPKCLARWQLQQAGRDEEIRCRFCSHALPTWAASFEEAEAKTAAPAVMAVVFNGKMVKLPITPGPDGVEIFKREVRRIFQLADDVSLDVTFELKVPTLVEDNNSKVYLKGFQAFDAASTVAQMAASKRAAYQPQQSDLDATTGPSSSQLQQAGREEEIRCRFCQHALPTWSASFADSLQRPEVKSAVPIMAVVYNGMVVKLPCKPGPDGAEIFKRQVCRIFQLADDVALDVTFEVMVPELVEDNSSKVYLKGFHAFDAASTVAQMCASKRAAQQSQQQWSDRVNDDATAPSAASVSRPLSSESDRSSLAFAGARSSSASSGTSASFGTSRAGHAFAAASMQAPCEPPPHSPAASPSTSAAQQRSSGGPAVAAPQAALSLERIRQRLRHAKTASPWALTTA